ncbi:MAG: hypothetical protein UY05_C0004G0016 [Candidatus Peregrinibacteria bacterium GW2011_GWA2_47_7]|nr:MAG: hypothetical protein UY05_C0004G0016 [Candidatus Peregrinibacteria bacterium GW2011_GWA2_47_7]
MRNSEKAGLAVVGSFLTLWGAQEGCERGLDALVDTDKTNAAVSEVIGENQQTNQQYAKDVAHNDIGNPLPQPPVVDGGPQAPPPIVLQAEPRVVVMNEEDEFAATAVQRNKTLDDVAEAFRSFPRFDARLTAAFDKSLHDRTRQLNLSFKYEKKGGATSIFKVYPNTDGTVDIEFGFERPLGTEQPPENEVHSGVPVRDVTTVVKDWLNRHNKW